MSKQERSPNRSTIWASFFKANGPYRTRTVGDESNLEIARTQIEALLSLATVADDEQLQRLVSIWSKLDDATKEVIL